MTATLNPTATAAPALAEVARLHAILREVIEVEIARDPDDELLRTALGDYVTPEHPDAPACPVAALVASLHALAAKVETRAEDLRGVRCINDGWQEEADDQEAGGLLEVVAEIRLLLAGTPDDTPAS